MRLYRSWNAYRGRYHQDVNRDCLTAPETDVPRKLGHEELEPDLKGDERTGRPYLDVVEYTIIPNRSTAILAFVAGNFNMTFPLPRAAGVVTTRR